MGRDDNLFKLLQPGTIHEWTAFAHLCAADPIPRLRLPAEGLCECDLGLRCSKFFTTSEHVPRMRFPVGPGKANSAWTPSNATDPRDRATGPSPAASTNSSPISANPSRPPPQMNQQAEIQTHHERPHNRDQLVQLTQRGM